MVRLFLIVFTVLGTFGCGLLERGNDNIDSSLYGSWAYADGAGFEWALNWSAPNNFKSYLLDTGVGCEALLTGTSRTQNQVLYNTRTSGEVTSNNCRTYFGLDSSAIGFESSGTSYSVVPGTSVTFYSSTGGYTTMVSYDYPWGNLPQQPTTSFRISGEGALGNLLGDERLGDSEGIPPEVLQ